MDIQSCCSIAIVVRSALWTSPFTNPQIFDLWILVSANGAELTRWKKLVYFHYLGSHLSAYVFQDALKRGEAIVHNLFSVACLHELHGQIFETDDGIFFAKFFCQLPMAGVSFVGCFAIEPCKFLPRPAPIVGMQTLAG